MVARSTGGWRPDAKIDRWARAELFGEPRPMTLPELRAFSAEFDGHPRGLYMFECENHEVYVGISGSTAAGRLRSHLKTFHSFRPQTFRFQTFDGTTAEFRSRERDLIWSSVWAGFTSLNREHSNDVVGASEFDDVVSVVRQERWLADPRSVNTKERNPVRPRSESQFSRSRPQFDRFAARPDADRIVDALGAYLANCVPFPRTTEATHWALTCLSNTRLQDKWRRVATLSIAYVETLWISESPDGAEIHVCIGTDYRELPAWRTASKLKRHGALMCGVVHRSGGVYEEGLLFDSPTALVAALDRSPEIRAAAARFALDRMRKSAVSGRYAEAHNYLFAERALKAARRRP